MRTPRRKRPTLPVEDLEALEQARAALAREQRALHHAASRGHKVRALRAQLAELNDENHFAIRFRQMLEGEQTDGRA